MRSTAGLQTGFANGPKIRVHIRVDVQRHREVVLSTKVGTCNLDVKKDLSLPLDHNITNIMDISTINLIKYDFVWTRKYTPVINFFLKINLLF